jgi:hypothetical protein
VLQYTSSIHALQELLTIGPPTDKEQGGKGIHCKITRTPQSITYMRNGLEYCFIEVTCDDGAQYGIQTYGEEAKELYKEAHRCFMCGNTPTEPKKSNIVEEIIDGTRYSSDSNGCALAFRKLSSVLGETLF